MAEIHTLILKSDSTGIKQSSSDLDSLTNSANKADNSTSKLGTTSRSVSSSMGLLKASIVGVVASLGIKELATYADTWTSINSRLLLATSSIQEFTKAQTELFNIANETRTAYEETANLYTRLEQSTRSLGTSQNDLFTITETVNKALVISGASTAEASSAVTQLGQGLASGVLRGEEFNSIMENGSRIAQVLADSLGVSRGELRQMAQDGQLTADVVTKALTDQADTINREFGKMKPTMEQAGVVVDNVVGKLVNRFDEVSGSSESVSRTLIEMSGWLEENIDDIAEFGADTVRTVKLAANGLSQIYQLAKLGWLEIGEAFASEIESTLNAIIWMFESAYNSIAETDLGKALGYQKTTFERVSLSAADFRKEITATKSALYELGQQSAQLQTDIFSDTTLRARSISTGGTRSVASGASASTQASESAKAAKEIADKEAERKAEELQKLKDQQRELLEALYPVDALVQQWENQQSVAADLHNRKMISDTAYKDAMLQSEEDYQNKLIALFKSGAAQRESFMAMSAMNQTKTVISEMINMTQGVATQNKVMFNINKAAALANAGINLYEGVSKTLAAYPYPISVGMAALQTAAGLAQIHSIASASFGGGASTSGVAPSQIGTTSTPVTVTNQQTTQVPTQAPQQITIQLGADDMLISTASVRKLIEQINETAGDMGMTLRVI